MACREFDVVVFGATGYTGSKIFTQLLKSRFSERIAIAGRHKETLESTLCDVEPLLQETRTSCHVIVADSSDPASLLRMAKATRVLINAVGPFRFHGRAVVQACVDAGTHYLDISGEPEFMERVELDFGDAARDKGVFIVSACGFDSVPVDIGNAMVYDAFPSGCCTSIETFIELVSGPSGLVLHYPTYESAVHGIGSADELKRLRRELAEKREARNVVEKKSKFPLKMKPPGTYVADVDKVVIPFIGADASVVRRSQLELEQSYSSKVYMCLPSKWRFYQFAVYGSIFKLLAGYSFGRRMLLGAPRLFCPIVSTSGPTEQQLKETKFKVTLIGRGMENEGDEWPSKTVKLEINGPEPGYIACSIFVTCAAKILLNDGEQQLGSGKKGGVLTPASLLFKTSYVDLLKQHGIAFSFSDISSS